MFQRSLALATLLAGGLLSQQPALAQSDADPQAVWDYFVSICGAVVDAPDPAMFAAAQGGDGSGQAGRSGDGLVTTSSLMLDGVAGNDGIAMLVTNVNAFPEGRMVQCMLQLPQPDPALMALTAIAQEQAGDLLEDDFVAAGGALAAMSVADGMPTAIEVDEEASMLRLSTGGFPPSATLLVQAMPRYVALIYYVVQAGAD